MENHPLYDGQRTRLFSRGPSVLARPVKTRQVRPGAGEPGFNPPGQGPDAMSCSHGFPGRPESPQPELISPTEGRDCNPFPPPEKKAPARGKGSSCRGKNRGCLVVCQLVVVVRGSAERLSLVWCSHRRVYNLPQRHYPRGPPLGLVGSAWRGNPSPLATLFIIHYWILSVACAEPFFLGPADPVASVV